MYYSNPFNLSYIDGFDRHLLVALPSQSCYCEYRSLACCYLAFLLRLLDFSAADTRTFLVARFLEKLEFYGFEQPSPNSIIIHLESYTWINRNTCLSLNEPLGLYRFMSSFAYVFSRHTIDERSFDYAYNILLERVKGKTDSE